MKSARFKGYLYALIATVAFSNIYIFSKAALNEVHLSQFGFYWYLIGCFLNFLLILKTGNIAQFKSMTRADFGILALLGFMEIATTSSFFISIHIIPDPAVTSFLGNLYPVMLTIMGVGILKERFGALEWFGVALALIGAFLISYQGGDSLSRLFIPGTSVVVFNALLAAATSIVVKKNIHRFSPELFSFNRTFWLLLFSAGAFVYYKQTFAIPFSALKNIAIGAIIEPLALLTIYLSFKYIEASRSSIIQSLKGIFVLAGTFLYLGTIPAKYQLIGGLLTVLGVLVMTLAQARLIRIGKTS